MSLQDSTFRTAHVLDNEIIKANDFEFAFEQLVTNVSKATQMLMESNQDFVINGRVLVDTGMNVRVSPIYGVCKSTGLPFGRTEETDETIGFEGSSSGRVDILEVKGDWETYDEQQRAFNDPDTDTQTYQYIDTKKLMKPVYQVKKGVEGSNVAPEVDTGYVKLAEVVIRAGISQLSQNDIKNITADVAGENNEDWTTQPAITYNIGYISDVNARFREQHNADGTHKDDVIDIHSLNIGTGENQVNGNILPVGGSVTLPTGTIIGSESIKSAITAVAAVVTTIYNTYLKYGSYGFKGTLAVSSIADANNNLTKPITITAAGDGTAVIKIDGAAVLSIDSTGKLSTNGYTATASNHIVTKAVTDAISNSLSALATRVTNLENELADNYKYINKTLSRDRYDYTGIQAAFYATTENITLSGSQIIDGATPNNGDLILVKDQTNKKENGLYSYSNNSAWTRYTPFSTPSSYLHKLFVVSYGTSNNKKIFLFPNEKLNNPDTFGYDDFEFNEYVGTIDVSSNANANVNKFVMRDSDGRIRIRNKDKSITDYAATRTEVDNLYGNVVGTALGTAAVGTASTFARSDHVHPIPSCVIDKYRAESAIGIGYACAGLSATQVAHFAAFSTVYETGCVIIKDVTPDVVKQVLGLGSAAYANVSDFRPSSWVPDTVNNACNACNACSAEFSIRACGLPELAGYGCVPHATWALHNIWNLCGDNRNFLISYPSNDPSGNARQQARVSYADCTLTTYVESRIANFNYSVAITSDVAGTHGYYGISSCCPFTFNPTTGVVTANCFNGIAASLSFDNSVYVHAERNNELNIYTTPVAWINYRGGAWKILIGDGSGTGACGTIQAACFAGPATSAESAGTANIANKAYNIPVCSGGQHINWGSIWICC